jgi:hypothetical protein
MRSEIHFSPATGLYCWELWDGPDGVDYRTGYCQTLSECFERVFQARVEIGQSYTAD